MEALFVLTAVIVALVTLDALSLAFGVDSRDGLAEDHLRPTLR